MEEIVFDTRDRSQDAWSLSFSNEQSSRTIGRSVLLLLTFMISLFILFFGFVDGRTSYLTQLSGSTQ